MISFEEYCKENKQSPESKNALNYCLYVQDLKEVRDKIKDSYNAYWYCINVQNDYQVSIRIIDEVWINRYFIDFGFKPSEHPEFIVAKKMDLI